LRGVLERAEKLELELRAELQEHRSENNHRELREPPPAPLDDETPPVPLDEMAQAVPPPLASEPVPPPPTDRPTPNPTPNPTPYPTPLPTSAPTPLPTAALPVPQPPAAVVVSPPAVVKPLADLHDIGIVVMTFNRPAYLKKCLSSLQNIMPTTGVYPYISEDGERGDIKQVAAEFPRFTHLNHKRPAHIATAQGGSPVYYYISEHYRFVFNELFDKKGHKYVILLEDDMSFSVDFFPFFMATLPLMEQDKSIWSVSSWNDNGQSKFVQDPAAIYRSDYFPGLGWATSKTIWNELKPKWPLGFWDDWLRLPEQRKDRVTIRPEISRTGNFGKSGASGGEFFEEHIGSIKVNSEAVDFAKQDLTYLFKQNYDKPFTEAVRAAQLVSSLSPIAPALAAGPKDYRVVYNTLHDYEKFASANGLMEDSKAGVARGAYMGVVTIRWLGNRVFFYPKQFLS